MHLVTVVTVWKPADVTLLDMKRQCLVTESTADGVYGKRERLAELPASFYYGEARCFGCPWSMTYGSSAVPPQVLFDTIAGHSGKCPGPVLFWNNTQERLGYYIVDGSSTVS